MTFLVDPFMYGGAGGGVSTTTFDPANTGSPLLLSNGNKTITATSSAWRSSRSTAGVSQGSGLKKYFEIVQDNVTTAGFHIVGIVRADHTMINFVGQQSSGYGYQYGLQRTTNGGIGPSYGGAAFNAAGTIVSTLFDIATGEVVFWVNGASKGLAHTISVGVGETFYAAASCFASPSAQTVRFASTEWTYTPPGGYTQW